MNRAEVLSTAESLINGDRQDQYGSATESFRRIAMLWSAVLGIVVRDDQVALCMALLKASRLCNTPGHADSWVDLAGYTALGGELATQ